MQIKAKRRIVVQLGKDELVDGHLSLTLNTDLLAHGHLSAIPTMELNRELSEALDRLIVRFCGLRLEYDKRGYSE